MSALTFTIPRGLWLTANREPHNRGHRKRIVGDLQHLAATTALAARIKPIAGPVGLAWTIHYPKGVSKKGDPVNAAATTKHLLDGLVPRWLPEDNPEVVTFELFRRGPNLSRPSDHEVRLVLTDQAVPF